MICKKGLVQLSSGEIRHYFIVKEKTVIKGDNEYVNDTMDQSNN